jgi:hypothetical protein
MRPHLAYGGGYYRFNVMGPRYYGGRSMMRRSYWRG